MPSTPTNAMTGSGEVGTIGTSSMGGFGTLMRCLDWRGWARAIVAIRATPRQVAMGVALGSFIAFTPFVGLQMLLAALVATLMGASRKAALLAVWISNPLTMGPIFLLTYQIGVLLCMPASATAGMTYSALLPVRGGPNVPAAEPAMTLGTLLQSGWGVVMPMLLGGVVIGLLAACLAYGLTHRGVRAFQGGRRGDKVRG